MKDDYPIPYFSILSLLINFMGTNMWVYLYMSFDEHKTGWSVFWILMCGLATVVSIPKVLVWLKHLNSLR